MTLPTFDKTITLFHCIKGTAETGYIDEWTITTLNKCSITKEIDIRTGVAVGNAAPTTRLKIKTLDIDNYITLRAYKKQRGAYTIAIGDFIVIDGITEKNITPKNIIEIVTKYKPDSVKVTELKENLTAGLLPHLSIRGV